MVSLWRNRKAETRGHLFSNNTNDYYYSRVLSIESTESIIHNYACIIIV